MRASASDRAPLEEFLVFGIGAGPSAFNVVNTQLIEFLGDEHFVIDGERDGFALRAVPESGIESLNAHGWFSTVRRLESALPAPAGLLLLSSLRNVIILRSSRPTFSIGLIGCASRMARNFWRPALFSADPLLGEFAGLDFGQDLLHFLAGLGVDDARAAGVIAVFGGVGNREAHVAEAAFIDQVDDQLELVQAFEVGDFGRVAGFDQRFESGADQFGSAAAEDGLLAEEIAFGLFPEGGFDDAGVQAAERGGIGQGVFESLAAGILMDGDEGGTPEPSTKTSRTRWPGALGAIMETSTSAGGLMKPKWMLKPWANISVLPCGQVRRDVAGRRDRPGCDRVPGSS